MRLRSITYLFLFISLMTFILGGWQLYRLDWKNDLIDNINNSINSPKIFDRNEEYEELITISLNNDFDLIDKPIFLESKTQQGKVGYHAVLPLTYKNNFYSIINLGWVSDKNPEYIKNIIGKIKNQESFYAYTRHLTDQKQSFVPENQPLKNIWFSILKSDLEGYYKSNFDSKYYFVLFDPRIKPDINPLAFLRNNHLNYSITWFLLSLSSVIMVLIIRRKHNG
jgi:surfeit locus 1 family protein